MDCLVENRTVSDDVWKRFENPIPPDVFNSLPVCYYCEDKIIQPKAFTCFSYGKRIWVCNRCIEDLKEDTGLEG